MCLIWRLQNCRQVRTLFMTSWVMILIVLHGSIYSQAASTLTPPKDTWITIFVHGMMSVKHHISLDNFMRFMTDNVQDSVYAKTVELMRADSHFYQNQAMQAPGLLPIDMHDTSSGNASTALAHLFNIMFQKSGHPPTNNRYYTFGWSGLLSLKARYDDAKLFFIALEKEIALFKKQGISPKIRIIGYSHGGNVSLNLAAIQRDFFPQSTLFIDELILVGMPVQHETAQHANSPIFGSIYNIYSRADRVQTLDLFSTHAFFSNRTFADDRHFKPSEKIKQIELRITCCTESARLNAQRLAHAGNFSRRSIISGKSNLLHDVSPGHAELWFFGWTPLNYRESYPLNPLPTVCFTPFITRYTSTINPACPDTPIIFDVRPDHAAVVIKSYPSGQPYMIVPFPCAQERKTIAQKITHFTPDDYTQSLYRERIAQAFRQASIIQTQLHPKPGTNRHPWLGKLSRKNHQDATVKLPKTTDTISQR